MSTETKVEYDLREVAAHKFWQDARPGDQFRHMGGHWPDVFFTFAQWREPFNSDDGRRYYGVTATRYSEWDERTYEYYISIPEDDRVLWFKQVPWKGLEK